MPKLNRKLPMRIWVFIVAVLLSPIIKLEISHSAEGVDAGRDAENQAVVILKDGRKKTGKILEETDIAVILEVGPGESLPIAKVRIERIERNTDGKKAKRQNLNQRAVPEIMNPTNPAARDPLAHAAKAEQKKAQALLEELKGLGSPLLEEREAAVETALNAGESALPILGAILNPKNKSDHWLRLGVLRALVELAPLDKKTAETLGFTAIFDPNVQVRIEACRSIRILKEDRAIGYVLQRTLIGNGKVRYAAAQALREIDDPSALAKLVTAVPMPSGTVNNTGGENLADMKRIDLPVGPGGTTMPFFLPEGEVQGKMKNISSPASDALKVIAGKNLGNLPMVWLNWLNEKIGAISAEERDRLYDRRSVLDRSNGK